MCEGPAPFKCQCPTDKCEYLSELNESCSQIDACINGNCFGTPLKCQCLPLQYFDQISGQCQNQLNTTSVSSSIATILSITTITIDYSSFIPMTSRTSSSTTTTSSTSTTTTTKSKLVKRIILYKITCLFILSN
jgi:hypothetical protein